MIANGDEAVDRLRLGFSLETKNSGGFGVDYAFHLPEHRLAHDYSAGCCFHLEASCKIDDVAMSRDIGALAAIHRPQHDGPSGEANPQLRTTTEFGFDLVSGIGKPFLDLERCTASSQRPIFKRDRRAEQGQHAIAGEVLHAAAVAMDSCGHQTGDLAYQRKGGLFTRLLDERSETDKVCHQDRYVAVLSLMIERRRSPLQQTDLWRGGHLNCSCSKGIRSIYPARSTV